MKRLYQFELDCGRMGSLDGIFIADSATVDSLIGKEVYFGEVLGKHSEISATIEWDNLTVKSDEQEFIEKLEQVFGRQTLSGFNPLDYLDG